MANKTYGKATKILKIDRYLGDVAVYQLSRAIKKDVKYLLVANTRPVSGGDRITVWASDETGKILDSKPIGNYPKGTVEDVLKDLGYNLA